MATVKIHPTGDILLVVGPKWEDNAPLLVSSTFLTLNSRVFSHMLDRRFKEGHDFAMSRWTSAQYRLELPDDDYDGVRMLCNFLHLRHDVTSPQDWTANNLVKLAVASDKYDCGKALEPFVTALILARGLDGSVEELRELLLISYLFDNAVLFAMISKDIILRDGSCFASFEPRDIMPEIVSSMLEEQRNNLRNQIQADFGHLLDRIFVLPDGWWIARPDFYEVVGNNCYQLNSMSLLPFPFTESVNHILSLLDPKILREMDTKSDQEFTLIVTEDDYAQGVRNGAHGLCLDCVRDRDHDPADWGCPVWNARFTS